MRRWGSGAQLGLLILRRRSPGCKNKWMPERVIDILQECCQHEMAKEIGPVGASLPCALCSLLFSCSLDANARRRQLLMCDLALSDPPRVAGNLSTRPSRCTRAASALCQGARLLHTREAHCLQARQPSQLLCKSGQLLQWLLLQQTLLGTSTCRKASDSSWVISLAFPFKRRHLAIQH